MAYKSYVKRTATKRKTTPRRYGIGRKRRLDMSPAGKERRKEYKRKMRNPMNRRKAQLARKKYYRKNKVKIRRRNKLYRKRMKRYSR